MRVLIIGAGLGGLACAIACRREGFEVVVLERANRLVPIGAGLQLPPNGTRIARQLGYLDKLLQCGVVIDGMEYRRYADGAHLHTLSAKDAQARYGDLWMVVHRADLHYILWQTCKEIGVDLCLDMDVERIDFDEKRVYLEDGDDIGGDVIIGADGLWSICRDQLLGAASPPVETGDLAYRATFPFDYLKALNDPGVDDLCARKLATVWMGPDKHTVFYPVRGGREFNLVLIRPDNMELGEKRVQGDIEEMRESYRGWDETLTKLISLIPRVQKWKLCTHPELKTWTKGCFALLGDSCHPSLPYQAQGAAMAVEDGAVIGKLLGLLKNSSGAENMVPQIPEILKLYETLRKDRTTVNVQGATSNRKWYHVRDGPEQEARDAEMTGAPLRDELSPTGWRLMDEDYRMELMGRDSVAEAIEAFKEWRQKQA
ncbi:hypothetical protein HER10_EVM0008315 [Colletotrichum scovillei]|uniref:FAD-binding domain-containing protein n=1 Tax=Colletotrichum scovillei TaxID=1209932 RepID=A0A9P7REA8_9PEZI|nr:uncharacterized protein HER10_EVM0008315 [Colletotrichum scovillei]KAF4785643.1 hypothetical protein HER10_EVM0008315 [Colletotrichum scovillei]KAG7054584.1 hypothetical protein JMJ77_0007062 [Colletotrichum scovillei]KAG7073992.1 hypothetical protein JMJ76_0010482 [Colletotrichum scovillei]KAG7081142.1 hypothetical protein JMJ78_0003270 [Colletotrichum scovillei]